MAALLGSNGYCQDRIVAIDYDSVAVSTSPATGGVDSPGADCTAANTPSGCGMIDRAVDDLLARFPQFTQVDLAGHSQGTFHCGTYLSLHADKIAHYINFSGVPDVGDVQTLSLSSLRDLNLPGAPPPHHATGTSMCAFQEQPDGSIVPAALDAGAGPASEGGSSEGGSDEGGSSEGGSSASGGPGEPFAGDAGGACNVKQITLINQDHFAVAASKDSFVQVYRYLNGGQDPKYTDIQCGDDPVTVEGVAETFADNTPIAGKLEIREVGTTPRDTSDMPMTLFSGDAGAGAPPGHFGPVQLKRNTQYVFTGYDATGKLVGWQYFTPFKRDNRLIRLLSPASGSDGSPVGTIVAAQSTNHVVSSTKTAVVIARWAQGGLRQDLGASLKVNGVEVLSSDNSGLGAAMNSSLQGGIAALFLEDANKNGETDLGLPYYTTFIAFTDVFIDATKPAFVNLSFTAGSEDPVTANVPVVLDNFPSSQGLIEVMFQ
jgi:hypothetical protein